MTTTEGVAASVREAADRLRRAGETRTPCLPVRDLIGSSDVDAAYAVQSLLTRSRAAAGARVVGRKIGLTSAAVQQQLGVDQPDFGVLFDDMQSSGEVDTTRLLQPKAEAEIAFRLGVDLSDGPLDVAQVREAVEYACAAIEVVDSRITDWDISFADTVADNASSGCFVLGQERRTLAEVVPREVTMEMTLDGEIVSRGTGAACLGDPLAALAWLAGTARDLGEPLSAGEIVLSGALGPVVTVSAGSVVTAIFDGLGSVTATFAAGRRRHTTDDKDNTP